MTSDADALAGWLDVIGRRWPLMVVRELVHHGPARFVDLRRDLAEVSPSALTRCLRRLERTGLVERRWLPAPAASHVYALTERGDALRGVIRELEAWSTGDGPPSQ